MNEKYAAGRMACIVYAYAIQAIKKDEGFRAAVFELVSNEMEEIRKRLDDHCGMLDRHASGKANRVSYEVLEKKICGLRDEVHSRINDVVSRVDEKIGDLETKIGMNDRGVTANEKKIDKLSHEVVTRKMLDLVEERICEGDILITDRLAALEKAAGIDIEEVAHNAMQAEDSVKVFGADRKEVIAAIPSVIDQMANGAGSSEPEQFHHDTPMTISDAAAKEISRKPVEQKSYWVLQSTQDESVLAQVSVSCVTNADGSWEFTGDLSYVGDDDDTMKFGSSVAAVMFHRSIGQWIGDDADGSLMPKQIFVD